LGYPGSFPAPAPIHAALGRLQPGDPLQQRLVAGNGIGLFNETNVCVACLSQKAKTDWAGRLSSIRDARVLAMVRRNAEQDPEPSRRERYLVSEWEVPIVEIVF
jgi:hypothetical protein